MTCNMRRELFIDRAFGQIRAAIVEDGVLCEILSEKESHTDETESLYLGRVQSIRPSMGAAFVDIGSQLNAFLPISEGMKLRCGDMMIVQGMAKQTTDSKGLRISEKVNLAGRWLVLLPGASGIHISKKVKDPALREALADVCGAFLRDGFGLIVRTAGEGVTEGLLAKEAGKLYARWEAVQKKASGMMKPGVLDQAEDLCVRLARDLRDVSRIVVSQRADFDQLRQLQGEQKISADTVIEHYEEKTQLLFDVFGIEAQIDKALKKRVWLPCGGYLIIDPCEAMTVIDVNSGKMILGRDPEETALSVNLEAAREVARQIRLRDIGGIIIVDFIDMKEEVHRQALIAEMKRLALLDRSQVSVEGLTRLGLMEISRKRMRAPLSKALRVSCSYCSGNAQVLSGEEVARRALRQARRMELSGQRGPFVIRCAPACASALESMRLKKDGAPVYALGVNGRHAEKFDIEQIGAGMTLPKEAKALQIEE